MKRGIEHDQFVEGEVKKDIDERRHNEIKHKQDKAQEREEKPQGEEIKPLKLVKKKTTSHDNGQETRADRSTELSFGINTILGDKKANTVLHPIATKKQPAVSLRNTTTTPPASLSSSGAISLCNPLPPLLAASLPPHFLTQAHSLKHRVGQSHHLSNGGSNRHGGSSPVAPPVGIISPTAIISPPQLPLPAPPAIMHLPPAVHRSLLPAPYQHLDFEAAGAAAAGLGPLFYSWLRREHFSLPVTRRIGHPYQNRTPPKRKKPRTSFTRLQVVKLEEQFQRQKYLASAERSALAKGLKMTDSQVKTWFQNRRTKWRRQTAEERDQERQAANRLMMSVPGAVGASVVASADTVPVAAHLSSATPASLAASSAAVAKLGMPPIFETNSEDMTAAVEHRHQPLRMSSRQSLQALQNLKPWATLGDRNTGAEDGSYEAQESEGQGSEGRFSGPPTPNQDLL